MRPWLILACLFAAAPAEAEPMRFYRADGRVATLEPVPWAGGLAVFVPGRPRPVELTDQLIVQAEGREALDPALLRNLALEPVGRLRALWPTWVLRASGPAEAIRACAVLVEVGQARWAVPDFRVPVERLQVPTDPLYPDLWHLYDADGQDIAVEGAWDLTAGDPQVIVAVVDTGVDPDHPDLDPTRMVPGRNTVADIPDASPTGLAIDHHGTACMGLVAASMDNDQGVVGVCPDCGWMPVRVFGDGAAMQLSALSEGISWAADNGAWVISNSWGIGQELIDAGVDVAPIQAAMRVATTEGRGGLGCVILFAAGNGDADLNAMLIGPDELPAMEETLAVGGCDHLGAVAKYSDYGPYVWYGSDLGRLVRGGAHHHHRCIGRWRGQQGRRELPDRFGTDQPSGRAEPDGAGNYTQYFGGTSAATPIAAGVAGLVLSADPSLTWREVKALLQETAEQVGTQAESPRVAANYDEQGHDERYGYGRVHAERAVAVAMYGRDQPDGQACALDLNCAGTCLDQPAVGEGPACATACGEADSCQASHECIEGYCYQAQVVVDDKIVIRGGCGCGSSGHGCWSGLLGLAALLFLRCSARRRRRI